MKKMQAGLTLVELTLVIVVLGIIGAAIAVFIRPAFDSYIATRERAALHDSADVVLRRLLRDVREAVPNSVRLPNAGCFELLPASGGGRLRMDIDATNDAAQSCPPNATTPAANCSAPLDVTRTDNTTVDVLTPFTTLPAVNDVLVLGNQNGSEVYANLNRVVLTGVTSPNNGLGRHRLSFAAASFSPGFNSGRFSIVPAAQGPVFYVCSGADGTLDARGNGKGSLYRLSGYGFNATYPASCPATTGGKLMANNLTACSFVYSPTQGATQQFGFVWVQLEMTRRNERATVAAGAHVLNTP